MHTHRHTFPTFLFGISTGTAEPPSPPKFRGRGTSASGVGTVGFADEALVEGVVLLSARVSSLPRGASSVSIAAVSMATVSKATLTESSTSDLWPSLTTFELSSPSILLPSSIFTSVLESPIPEPISGSVRFGIESLTTGTVLDWAMTFTSVATSEKAGIGIGSFPDNPACFDSIPVPELARMGLETIFAGSAWEWLSCCLGSIPVAELARMGLETILAGDAREWLSCRLGSIPVSELARTGFETIFAGDAWEWLSSRLGSIPVLVAIAAAAVVVVAAGFGMEGSLASMAERMELEREMFAFGATARGRAEGVSADDMGMENREFRTELDAGSSMTSDSATWRKSRSRKSRSHHLA